MDLVGLNFETGETVAIKEIQLSNIPANELPEIMVSRAQYILAVLRLMSCSQRSIY